MAEPPFFHVVTIEDTDKLRRFVNVKCSCGWHVHHETPNRCTARVFIANAERVVECERPARHDGLHEATAPGMDIIPDASSKPVEVRFAWR